MSEWIYRIRVLLVIGRLEYSVYSSDLEVDVLDNEDESDASSEGSVTVPGRYPSQVDKLQKADEAAIARGRSIKKTSSERIAASENAKKTKASQGLKHPTRSRLSAAACKRISLGVSDSIVRKTVLRSVPHRGSCEEKCCEAPCDLWTIRKRWREMWTAVPAPTALERKLGKLSEAT